MMLSCGGGGVFVFVMKRGRTADSKCAVAGLFVHVLDPLLDVADLRL